MSADKLDFNDIKPPVKIKDIHNIEKYNSINIGAFGYENKKTSNLCICYQDKHVDLLLVGIKDKNHYVLIKDVNTFIYYHTLHRGRKIFCSYCLQAFSTKEI